MNTCETCTNFDGNLCGLWPAPNGSTAACWPRVAATDWCGSYATRLAQPEPATEQTAEQRISELERELAKYRAAIAYATPVLVTAKADRDRLAEELKQAREELAEIHKGFEGHVYVTSEEYGRLTEENARLKEQLAEAQRDGERLDWLEIGLSNHRRIEVKYWDHDGRRFTICGDTLLVHDFSGRAGEKETLRVAIDAAMQPLPEPPAQ